MPTELNYRARWTVTALPLPKRMAFARVSGFCGGHVVGETESRNGGAPTPHWWPGGEPAPITHPAQKRFSARSASGDAIAGFWSRSGGGFGGACGWRRVGNALEVVDLHPGKAWDHTIAMGSGAGAYAGSGERKVKKGESAVDVGLLWRPDGTMVELPPAEAGNEAMAENTDGAWVVGRVGRTGGQRAALWPADAAARPLPPVNLTEAAVRGDINAVRAFLDGGAAIEQRTIGFASPLAAAAGRGHLDVVKLLIERGASLDPEGSAFPLLAFTIANRKLDVVEYVLKAGAPVAKYRNHLREAVKLKQWDMVDAMLAGGADPRWLADAERSELDAFVAREQPRSPVYRQRLREEQARRFERERVTPAVNLLTEADRAHYEAAALAEANREPALARARTGNATPVLALAVSAGAHQLVHCLLDAGADPDDGGAAESPLARAATRSDAAMLKALLDAGADPNRSGSGSPHPLLAAAVAGSLACVEALRARGARPRARDLKAAIDGVGGPDAARIAHQLGELQTPAAAQKRRAAAEVLAPEPRKEDADAIRQAEEEVMDMGDSVEGKVFSSSGTFESLTQTEIGMSVEIRGGVYAGSVTKKTNVLVAGAKAGAKLEKAKALGVRVMTEAQFHALLGRIPITDGMKRRYLG